MPYATVNGQTPEPQNMASQDRPQHFLGSAPASWGPNTSKGIDANNRRKFASGANDAARTGANTSQAGNAQRRGRRAAQARGRRRG